jgi:Flp pilus assembly protein TadD
MAVRSTPDDAHVHLDFAQLALQAGQTADALVEFREVARCEPSAETWSTVAMLQTRLGKPAAAIEACRQAARLDPTVPCVAGR